MRVPRRDRDKDKIKLPTGQQPRKTKRKRKRRPWRKLNSRGPTRKPPGEGERSHLSLWQSLPSWKSGGAVVGSRFLKKKEIVSGSNNTRICPTNDDDDGVGQSVVRPITAPHEGEGADGGIDEGNEDRGSGGIVGNQEQDHERSAKEGEDKLIINTDENEVEDGFDGDGDSDSGSHSDEASDGEFSVDIDMVDDVTSDEGFELGEVSLFASTQVTKSGWCASARAAGSRGGCMVHQSSPPNSCMVHQSSYCCDQACMVGTAAPLCLSVLPKSLGVGREVHRPRTVLIVAFRPCPPVRRV